MVDYSNAKIKIHVAVAEKLFRIGNDQVAILRWKCAISTGGGIFLTRSILFLEKTHSMLDFTQSLVSLSHKSRAFFSVLVSKQSLSSCRSCLWLHVSTQCKGLRLEKSLQSHNYRSFVCKIGYKCSQDLILLELLVVTSHESNTCSACALQVYICAVCLLVSSHPHNLLDQRTRSQKNHCLYVTSLQKWYEVYIDNI